jgi:hypothetical protein
MIPQQEIPGQMPSAFVMRHPSSGNIEVWWSPCPSRECPQEEEITIVVNSCQKYCVLLEDNPKIEALPHSTKKNEAIEKKRVRDANITAFLESFTETTSEDYESSTLKSYIAGGTENKTKEIRQESWVGDSKKL